MKARFLRGILVLAFLAGCSSDPTAIPLDAQNDGDAAVLDGPGPDGSPPDGNALDVPLVDAPPPGTDVGGGGDSALCNKVFIEGGTYKKPDGSETLVIDRVTGKVTWTFVQAGKTYTATYTLQGSEF